MGESEGGGLTLAVPELAVSVEDARAKEVAEDSRDTGALRVVIELGLEDVLDIFRQGGHDAMDTARAEEDGGVCRVGGEHVGGPVKKAMAVRQELRKGAQDRVGFEPMAGFEGAGWV